MTPRESLGNGCLLVLSDSSRAEFAHLPEIVFAALALRYVVLAVGPSSPFPPAPLAFGAMVLLTVTSIGLYYALEGLERLLLPWAPEE